jgi:Carboxypeptidase regulatory-like domain
MLLLASTGMTRGQVRTTGQLGGTVLDSSGAAVSGAAVTVSQPATGFSQTVTANDSGEYVFPALQPGAYQVKVSAGGFSDAVYDHVVVGAARGTDLKVQLKVAQASETVRVAAEGEVLETTTNTLSSTISPEGLQELPLNGRDVLPFAQLVPGAQSGGDQRFTTYNSLPNAAVNITLDGVNDNFQRYRTSTTGSYRAFALGRVRRSYSFDRQSDRRCRVGRLGAIALRDQARNQSVPRHGILANTKQRVQCEQFTNNALGLKISPFHVND